MLSFRVHHFQIGERHYILLPKLNTAQMQILSERLSKNGYSVRRFSLLSGRFSGSTVIVDPMGLCWSTVDPSDAVLPALPEILSSPKERVPVRVLESMYFKIARSGRTTLVRMSNRLEHSSAWDLLRKSGGCALAPDEGAVASFLMKSARGTCKMLTEFPADASIPRIFGRKRYFETTTDCGEAKSTLRVVGEHGLGNSYLPRDETLRVKGILSLPRNDLVSLFEGLGEWCFFTPA